MLWRKGVSGLDIVPVLELEFPWAPADDRGLGDTDTQRHGPVVLVLAMVIRNGWSGGFWGPVWEFTIAGMRSVLFSGIIANRFDIAGLFNTAVEQLVLSTMEI